MPRIALPHGSVLCHYTTGDAAFESILAERRLRFSPYSRMRDPYEAQPWRFAAAHWPGNFEGVEDEMQTFGEAHQGINELKFQTKLLALTEDTRDETHNTWIDIWGRGWARPRMWEQYSENHHGACLVFDREQLRSEIRADLAENADELYFGAVKYSPTGISGAHLSFHLDNFKGDFDAALAETLKQNYRSLFFLKTLDWESEHEYRFVARRADEDYLFVPFADSLKAVIVGGKFPEWQVPGALALCDQLGVALFRLKWLPEGPWPVDLRDSPPEEAGPDPA